MTKRATSQVWVAALAAIVGAACAETPAQPEQPKVAPAPSPPPRGAVVAEFRSGLVTVAANAAKARGLEGLAAPLEVRLQGTDAYGAATAVPGVTFTWSPEDLARVDWAAIDKHRLLDLATFEPGSPDGFMALSDWCGAAHRREATPRLCAEVARREAGL